MYPGGQHFLHNGTVASLILEVALVRTLAKQRGQTRARSCTWHYGNVGVVNS